MYTGALVPLMAEGAVYVAPARSTGNTCFGDLKEVAMGHVKVTEGGVPRRAIPTSKAEGEELVENFTNEGSK